ncbi:hypothetical protein F5884DRAFT_857167 [Xylogone sp. PMI_703]|nr:hypothetical protein F5884DRAFT_857167 [Xylogone sp. PMI_703]
MSIEERYNLRVLDLDCVERVSLKPRWLGIYIMPIGPAYVRVSPGRLYHFPNRTELDGSEYFANHTIYISRDLSFKDTQNYKGTSVTIKYYSLNSQAAGSPKDPITTRQTFLRPLENYIRWEFAPSKLWPPNLVSHPALVWGIQGASNRLWAVLVTEIELKQAGNAVKGPRLRDKPKVGYSWMYDGLDEKRVWNYFFEKYPSISEQVTMELPRSLSIPDRNNPSRIYHFCFRIEYPLPEGGSRLYDEAIISVECASTEGRRILPVV